MRVAIIPARSGSKRIPNKNIRIFAGKPIIGWSIEAALEAECFDKVIVSTDSEKIAEIARDFGAEVPFLRQADLSGDHVSTAPVISDVLRNIKMDVDYACCIYATAPLLEPKKILEGLQLIEAQNVDFVFSATRYSYPIQRALKKNSNQMVTMLNPDLENVRSQDLEVMFHDAGQFYWGKSNAWLEGKPILHNSCILEILEEHAHDIDTEKDWRQAEIKFELLQLMKRGLK